MKQFARFSLLMVLCSAAWAGPLTLDTLSLRDLDDVVGQQFRVNIDPSVPREIGCHLAMIEARGQSWASRQYGTVEQIENALLTAGLENEYIGMDGRPALDQLAFVMAGPYGLVGPGREMASNTAIVVKDGNHILAVGIFITPYAGEEWGSLLNILVRQEAADRTEELQRLIVDRFTSWSVWNSKPKVHVRATSKDDRSMHATLKSQALTRLGFESISSGMPEMGSHPVINWELTIP